MHTKNVNQTEIVHGGFDKTSMRLNYIVDTLGSINTYQC